MEDHHRIRDEVDLLPAVHAVLSTLQYGSTADVNKAKAHLASHIESCKARISELHLPSEQELLRELAEFNKETQK
eukprot:gene11171-3229_t